MIEWIVTRNNEELSFNVANSIFSSMYGGPKVPKTQVSKSLAIYDGGLIIKEKDGKTNVYGDLPPKILNKLNDYKVVLKR